MDRVPGHPSPVVGLGAGHRSKFARIFGRLLTDPSYAVHWLV